MTKELKRILARPKRFRELSLKQACTKKAGLPKLFERFSMLILIKYGINLF